MSRSTALTERISEAVEAKSLSLSDKQFGELLKSLERESKRQLEHERYLERISIIKLLIVGTFTLGAIFLIAKTNPGALSYAVPSLISVIGLVLGAKKLLKKKDTDTD